MSRLSKDEEPLTGANAMPISQRTRTPRRVWALALVIAAIYLLDLQLPRALPLLSFYWIPVLLAATFASPRQVGLLALEALTLGVASGLQLGMFVHPDYSLRLVALAAISGLTLRLAQERQHHELSLAGVNSQLEATLKALPDLLFEVTREGRFVQVHALQPDLLVRPADQIVGRRLEEVLPRAAVEICRGAIAEAETHGISLGRQILLPLPDGERWFELSAACKRPVAGQAATVIVLSRDVHGHKQAEASLQRQIRFYAVLSRCTHAIAHSQCQQQLLGTICREAIATGDLRMAWVGFINRVTGLVEPVAMAGEGSEYLHGIQITTSAGSRYGRGPTGSAIRTGQPYWCQDFMQDPNTGPWHERGRRFQWGSSAALPLRCEGEVIGALMLYAGMAHAFDDEIQRLLLDLAIDIDLALERFARDQRERDARRKLETSERDYRELTETIHDVIWRMDAHTFSLLYVSRAVQRLLGQSPAMLTGRSITTTLAPESQHWIEELTAFRERMTTEATASTSAGFRIDELQQRHQDGSVVWSEVTTTLVTNHSSGRQEFHCVSRDISARKQAELQVQWMTCYDPLTELPNRTLMPTLLEQVIRTANREGKPVAVLMLGLDRFKTINDSISYATGDAILREVAVRLRQNLRENDVIGRVGGDEFLLVLPGTDAATAAELSERLQAAIGAPFQVADQAISLTSSVGIACFPADSRMQQDLVRMADTALSHAKRDGRNRLHFFTAALQREMVRKVAIANALHGALDRNELQIVYQPQLEASSGRLVGAEALLRWRHPEFGNVSPIEFIPIAETTSDILPIGEWVLQQAIHQLKEWLELGLPLERIAVNLSAVQFRQTDLPVRVSRLLQEAGIAGHQLEIELTESVMLDNPEIAMKAMSGFQESGVQLSIDDFGTGYSSLSYLKRLRVNRLKIDASFIRDLAHSRDDQSIVSAIINLARGLNLRTIAEGVETTAQWQFLQQSGCDEIQGFLIARPLAAEAFVAFAREYRPNPS